MRTIILLAAVLLIIFVCENAAASKKPTNIRRKQNSNGRPLAMRRLLPVDFSQRRPSWLRKRKQRPKRPNRPSNRPKKPRNKNRPKKVKANKKKDGKSKLVEIQSSPQQAGLASGKVLKKNERYFDPKVLEKLNRIHSIQDIIREFKPEGFQIKKETKMVRKISNDKEVLGLTGPLGAGRVPDADGGVGMTGPTYVYESKVEDVVYFGSTKVMDPAPAADVVSTGCALTNKQESISALGTFFHPNCVVLKRCGGCCKFGQECIAVGTKNKTLDVFRYTPGVFKYEKKTFIEHASCACQCIVKASDCYPQQIYSQKNCQCECNKSPQTCPSDRIWSHGNCDCICSNRQICELTRQKWDEKTCKCICSNKCPVGKEIEPQSCRCINRSFDSVGPLEIPKKPTGSLSLVKSSADSSAKSTFTDDFNAPSTRNEHTDTEEEEEEDGEREREDDSWDDI